MHSSPARRLPAALLLAAIATAQDAAPRAVAPVLQNFDFDGVTLDAGLLRRELDEVREYYLRIPNDDLLRPFRARAGRPAPGAVLGGWYAADVFHVFGQIVSGLARLHAATGDPDCAAKVRALVHGFGECVEPDGWFFASKKPNAPHYIFDKLVGGLVDARRYCADPEAAGLLARMVSWAEKNLARDRQRADTSTEWYTLGENLDRAFLLTGDGRYCRFARVWDYAAWWDLLRERGDPFAAPPQHGYHAYSHCNTLGSAARAAEVTGERRYLDAAIAGHDWLLATQAFATGGFGPDEQLLPAAALRERLLLTHHSAETQCGAWAVFKLCKQLLRLTGDARFGDWVERQAYNAVAATIPASTDGRVFYYSDYCPTGASKFLHGEPWTCCAGTRPQAAAELVDLLYLRDGDDLCVNLFAPSTVRWQCRGTAVTVVQRTAFPADELVELTIATAAPVAFALRLRAPGWLREPVTAEVNGERVALHADERRWLEIARTFCDGDRVRVRMPVPLWSQPLPGGAQGAAQQGAAQQGAAQQGATQPTAILAGPVVLAVRTTGKPPHGRIDLAHLDDALEPCAGEPLCFHVRGAPDLLLRPFHAIGADEPYFVYLDPSLQNRVSHRDVAFQGGWQEGGRFRYSNQPGATAELAFDGTGIRWLGYAFDDAGIAEVTIDGEVVARVDQYGAGRDLPFDWRHQGLAAGRHLLHIRLTGERNEQSKDCYLNVAGFEVVPP